MTTIKRFRKDEPAPVVKPKGPRMNKLEHNYSLRLEAMKRNGLIAGWSFNDVTLRLGHDTRYTPDFCVWLMATERENVSLRMEFHETKGGFYRDDARVKLQVAARQTPWATFYLCKFTKGAWTITEVER